MGSFIGKDGKRHYHRKPTLKQKKALEYITVLGLSKRQAMLKAGYSKGASKYPGKFLDGTQGVKDRIEKLDRILDSRGIDEFKMADIIEGLSLSSDPKDKIAAFDRWYRVVKDIQDKDGKGQLKRKITLEEYVDGTPLAGVDGHKTIIMQDNKEEVVADPPE